MEKLGSVGWLTVGPVSPALAVVALVDYVRCRRYTQSLVRDLLPWMTVAT